MEDIEMTKTQLIAKVATDTGISKKTVGEVYDALISGATETLANGEAIQLSGFGSFEVKEKAAYTARNPKTNEPVEMPASKRISFTASKVLKEKVNQ